MSAISIQARWDSFHKAVFADSKPSDVQLREMRRAFYAGYQGCLMDCKHKLTELPEPEACRVLSMLEAEGIAFGIAVGLGLA